MIEIRIPKAKMGQLGNSLLMVYLSRCRREDRAELVMNDLLIYSKSRERDDSIFRFRERGEVALFLATTFSCLQEMTDDT